MFGIEDFLYDEGVPHDNEGRCWVCGEWSPLDDEGGVHCCDRKCTDFQSTPEGEAAWREYFNVPDNEPYVPMINADDFDWDSQKDPYGTWEDFEE